MKYYLVLIVSLIFLTAGCAHNPVSYSEALPAKNSVSQFVLLASASEPKNIQSATDAVNPVDEKYRDDETFDDYADSIVAEEKVEIADPLEPVNRVMHRFNDKLYFLALKPVAQGYKFVVPEPVRVSVKNFFSNLAFPARFLSCLLQADFSGAATETGRFTINTIWGIGGLLDPSSDKELDLQKQDTDLGQTLGVWGVGQGFYIVWPVFGPSSPRDSLTIAGDYFLYPVSYITPWYLGVGVRTCEIVNDTSLRIGDYEALKDAAIDPYVAFRDAYAQYRFKKIQARKAKIKLSVPTEEKYSSTSPVMPKKGN